MDESLSDFQEKKKTTAGPKKPKSKAKTLKRIRGQKDIRTAIKPKKNELLAYANDFDKICKQSGVDVDPEQLQVAIALSRSLQTQDNNCESQSSGSLNSQERTGRIRTTLLEYGFKVPEIKINATKKKRLRRQNYKLILKTEAEKQQIISDKYAQVLLKQLEGSKIIDNSNTNSKVKLYHIATQECYEILRSDSLFYIDNLIQQSQNTVGSLLRDWSKIPGRSATPTCDTFDVVFSEIECSEDELVTVLSGSIKSAQYIAKSKHRLLEKYSEFSPTNITENIVPENTFINSPASINKNSSVTDSKMNISHKAFKEVSPVIVMEETNAKIVENNCNDSIEIIDVDYAPKLQTLPLNIRSCSPDIFDEEVSSIMDHSKGNTDTLSQNLSLSKTVTNNEVMDLTECVKVVTQRVLTLSEITNEQPNLQPSQLNNVTKRKSNDFMEITNCVAGSSQPLVVNNVENIDLTQHSDDREVALVENKIEAEREIVGNMDLTQSSNTDDELPFVQVSGKKNESLDNTIILNEDAYNYVHEEKKSIALEEDHSLDDIEVDDRNSKEQEPNLETVSPKEVSISINPVPIEIDEDTISQESTILNTSKESLDVSAENSKSPTKIQEFVRKSKTESFFEEFIHEHSDDGIKELKGIVSLEDSGNKVEIDNKQNDNNIDLTQSTDSERTIDEIIETNSPQNKCVDNNENHDNNIDLTWNTDSNERPLDDITDKNKSSQISFGSLGKIGDRSIDYDEIFDDVVESYASTSKQSEHSKSVTIDGQNENYENKNSDLISNCSQNSEVFEIIDQEFEYSLNKSRHDFPVENFEFGGISIMDNISKIRSSKSTANEENIANHDLGKSIRDSLPMVYIKDIHKYDPKNTDTKSQMMPTSIPFTPYRNNINDSISIQTPTNSEYVIKTDQVTPLIDYASLSTPERNKELNKYGLKPFKRKRAIQLLTHLYNQTHPIIESCSTEDLPSPSKKLKSNNFYPKTSPKKLKSPVKSQASKSPVRNSQKAREINIEGTDQENNVYEITNEMPDIRDLECSGEDWLFQKREKAKLHSCRVPLHIAFHNYVSSRLRLREAILRYEPVNIDVIHKGLVASGHRYDPKDLLKFMDKKCITVKTIEKNSRNTKKNNK